MRVPLPALGIAILALTLFCPKSFGQDLDVCRRYHPWGDFQPGAWKLVRVYTERLDQNGLVTGTSTTDTRTTLLQMDDQGITLEVATTVEVAGKRFDREPQTLDQGYWGQNESQTVRPGKIASAQLTIGEQSVPCKVQELELIGSSTRTTSKVYFSEDVTPHVLRRESTTTTRNGTEEIGKATQEVVALDMPFRVLSEIHPTAHVRSVNRHPKGTVYTLSISSDMVPGGVVSHWSKEVDRTGRVVRRSTLDLLDYGTEGGQVRTGLFGRPRTRRSQRTLTP